MRTAIVSHLRCSTFLGLLAALADVTPEAGDPGRLAPVGFRALLQHSVDG